MSAARWLWETPIAHRGLHRLPDAPENSLAAFRAAADAGFAIELDVRRLRSGEVVVFHDANWLRLTGQTGTVEQTSANEIAGFRLAQTEEGVPFLRDVLETVAGRVPLLVELKTGGDAPVRALENAVLHLLQDYAGPVALQSFGKETVAYLRRTAPESVPCGQLAVDDNWSAEGESLPDFLGYAGYALPTPLTAAFRAGKSGPVLAWTLTEEAHVKALAPHADSFIFEHFIPDLHNTKENNSWNPLSN